MIGWFSNLPVPVQAALIGALASIFVGILRDFASKWWSEKREAQKSAEDVYRRYAEPLGSAVTSLVWRLREVFSGDGRASYLIGQGPKTAFENYKLRSTYYRLAAVLGWLRALRRELWFFRLEGVGRLTAIEEAIGSFESALADGHHVELQRLDGLLRIWGMPSISDNQRRLRVAVDIKSCAKRAIQNARVTSATDIPPEPQLTPCKEIAELVCSRANLAAVTPEILLETRSRAIRQIAIREAWLYRDWQAAIGDLMIREATVGNRHFEVLGFGDFESMMLTPTESQFRSLSRIAMLFDQVDVDREDPFDARPEALRKLYRATAGMVQVMAEVPTSAAVIDVKTAAEARRILEKSDDRCGT
jgi:hypothetical protein